MRLMLKAAWMLVACAALLAPAACQPQAGAVAPATTGTATSTPTAAPTVPAGSTAKAAAAAPAAPAVSTASAAPAALPAPDAAGVVWKFYIVESPSTGKIERFWVGHAATLKADGQYPVIYFLPGLLDDDDTWKAALDPHLAKYEIIAVCPAVGGASWFMNSPAQPWMKWGDFLTKDLRGFVESHYPAAKEKGQRGIAGISSGGHGAFYNAITRPDLYGSVGVLSGAVDLMGYGGAAGLDYWIGPRQPESAPVYAARSCVALAGKLTGPLPFALYLDAGDTDGARPQMEALKKVLDAKGATYKWFIGKGGHDWSYWNSRAADHLAWHAAEFARNKSEGKYPDKTPPKAAELKILDRLPDISLSDEAVRRLQAPWDDKADLVAIAAKGLDAKGTPLMANDPKHKSAAFSTALKARGHEAGLFVSRMTLTVVEPLAREGTILVTGRAVNGRSLGFMAMPPTPLVVPAGESQRRVELRARLAIELKTPDALRGGIIAAMQPFDAAGKPVGQPILTKLLPGTHELELWTVGPTMQAEWTVTLGGPNPLPLAAVQDVHVQAEP